MSLKIYDSSGILKSSTGGSGETNTASNIGTDGTGVYDQKVGVDLQFRNIASVDPELLDITFDAGDNDIDFTVLGSPTIQYDCLKASPGTITVGQVVCGTDYGTEPEVELADADNPALMPCIGIAAETITNLAVGKVVSFGIVTANTTGLSVGDAVYVDTTPGAWTTTRPTSTSAGIQKIGHVAEIGASGKIFVLGAGRTNDVPNLQDAYFWVGNASNQATAVTMSGEATMTNTGVVTVADGADGTAIHDNVAGEITAITEKVTPASADVLLIEDSAAGNVKKRLQIANLPAGSLPATVVETDQSNTYTTGTQNFVAATDVVFKDTAFQIQDDAAPTKVMRFDASAITVGTTRTYTTPNASTALAGAAGLLTFSNKTLDSSCVANLKDSTGFTLEASADPTRIGKFSCSSITTATTRTINFPDLNGTMVLTAGAQTLTDKTLTTPTIASFANAGHSHADAAGGGTLASAATPSAIHDDTAGEFAAITLKASPVSGDLLLIEDSAAGNAKKYITVGSLPAGGEVNNLAGDGIQGIADDQLAVGTGAGTAAYQTLPNGAVAYSTAGGTFAQAAASDLSNGTTGSGSVVLATSPTLVTPVLGTPTSGTLSNCDAFTGDSGAGGVRGLVPAPAAGDAAAGKYLDADGTWTVPPGGGAPHNLLDGSTHPDTVAQTVTRGSLVYGNATPLWDELVIGGAGTYLKSDGTDVAWGALDISQDTSPTLGGSLNTGGNSITYAGDQTIDLTGAATRTLTIQNSTASQQTNIDLDGNIAIHNNQTFATTVQPVAGLTGNRTISLPDATGTVVLTDNIVTLTNKTLTLPILSIDQTTTTAGQMTYDSTQGQLIYRVGSTDYAVSPFDSKGHVFFTPQSADEATFFYTTSISVTGVTVKSVCRGTTPSVAWEVRYASDRSAVGTSVASGTTTSTTTVETDTFTSSIGTGNFIWVELDTVSGTVDEFFIQIEIRYNRV